MQNPQRECIYHLLLSPAHLHVLLSEPQGQGEEISPREEVCVVERQKNQDLSHLGYCFCASLYLFVNYYI